MHLKGLGSVIVLAAAGAATGGAPAWALDVYATRVYPAVQAITTPLSNRVAIPLFDAVMLMGGLTVVGAIARGLRRSWRTRSFWPVARAVAWSVVAAATLYLWFLLAWGYNYRRPGVETAMPRFEPNRATPAGVRHLAEIAVTRSNHLYAVAHREGFPALDAVPGPLVDSLHQVERDFGRPRPTVPTRPKRPWTTPYMRAVGVSGMLAPLFLETYLNPDLTGPERPYVLAHEWAHLSGFAPEEDASFVGLVAALRADPASRYSAWLFLVSEAVTRLHPVTQQLVMQGLESGPHSDLEAISERLRQRVPWLDRASWVAYDQAIKSQGATEGVAGYGRVIDLLLGSDVLTDQGLTQ
jgi:hypothetical protein